MKLIGYTTTYNVESIVDIIMPYVSMLGYDRFVVYDNMSTDSTVDKLSKYPFVEIVKWDTGGVFNDNKKRDLEIGAFSECRELVNNGEDVWMTWTDFDEVLYYFHEIDFKSFLESFNAQGINCFYGPLIQPMLPIGCSRDDVINFVNSGRLPHEYDGVVVNHQYSKPILFHVNEFSNLYFIAGNHFILSEEDNVKNAENFPMTYLHFKYFFNDYSTEKLTQYINRGNKVYDDRMYFAQSRIRGGAYPIQMYFERLWSKIDINQIHHERNDCWGKLTYKNNFWK